MSTFYVLLKHSAYAQKWRYQWFIFIFIFSYQVDQPVDHGKHCTGRVRTWNGLFQNGTSRKEVKEKLWRSVFHFFSADGNLWVPLGNWFSLALPYTLRISPCVTGKFPYFVNLFPECPLDFLKLTETVCCPTPPTPPSKGGSRFVRVLKCIQFGELF